MLFGLRERFGIEIGGLEVAESKCLAQFRFWVAGEALGDWQDRILLAGSIEYATMFVQRQEIRERSEVKQENALEIFYKYYEWYYCVDNELIHDLYDYRDIFHMDDIGMSSLQDKYGIILVPNCSGSMSLVVKRFKDEFIFDQSLRKGEAEDALIEYIQFYKNLLNCPY